MVKLPDYVPIKGEDIVAVPLYIKRLLESAVVPEYAYGPGDSGFDLAAAEPAIIQPFSTGLVRTGWAMAVPRGFEIQLRLRSGVAKKRPLIMPNAPATIDADYRGEVMILLRNVSDHAEIIEVGTALAQGVVAPVRWASIREVDELTETDRGEGGFGSTGDTRC